jgi:hypothetical protein
MFGKSTLREFSVEFFARQAPSAKRRQSLPRRGRELLRIIILVRQDQALQSGVAGNAGGQLLQGLAVIETDAVLNAQRPQCRIRFQCLCKGAEVCGVHFIAEREGVHRGAFFQGLDGDGQRGFFQCQFAQVEYLDAAGKFLLTMDIGRHFKLAQCDSPDVVASMLWRDLRGLRLRVPDGAAVGAFHEG